MACKQYFIQIFFYNECSHETDWCILGENNDSVLSEENGKLFNSINEANEWIESDEANEWKPCKFCIKKSAYCKD